MPKDMTKPLWVVPESLKFKGNHTKVGAKTSQCFTLEKLYLLTTEGFLEEERAHLLTCKDCIIAYANYLRLRRAEARDKLDLSMDGVALPDMDTLK